MDSLDSKKPILKIIFGVMGTCGFLITVGIYINKIETLEDGLKSKNDEIKILENRIVELERKVHLNEYIIGDIKNGKSTVTKNVKTNNGKVDVDINELKGGGKQ